MNVSPFLIDKKFGFINLMLKLKKFAKKKINKETEMSLLFFKVTSNF